MVRKLDTNGIMGQHCDLFVVRLELMGQGKNCDSDDMDGDLPASCSILSNHSETMKLKFLLIWAVSNDKTSLKMIFNNVGAVNNKILSIWQA